MVEWLRRPTRNQFIFESVGVNHIILSMKNNGFYHNDLNTYRYAIKIQPHLKGVMHCKLNNIGRTVIMVENNCANRINGYSCTNAIEFSLAVFQAVDPTLILGYVS